MHSDSKPEKKAAKTEKTDTHNKILDSALAEFLKEGYKGATTRNIAYNAEVNEITLFRHFGSKEKLLKKLVEREIRKEDFLEKIKHTLTGDPIRDLTNIGVNLMSAMNSLLPVIRLIITVLPHSGHETKERWFPEGELNKLVNVFREFGVENPEMVTTAYISFFFRHILALAIRGKDPVIEMNRQTIRDFVTLLVKGLQFSGNK